jgi:peptidoglycan hydrolase-like protein with peptidoglycan-binding domain
MLAALLAVSLVSVSAQTATDYTRTAEYSEITRDLSRGMQGDDVMKLQEYLYDSGYLIATGDQEKDDVVTGFFGKKTETAVKEFQTDQFGTVSPARFGRVMFSTKTAINAGRKSGTTKRRTSGETPPWNPNVPPTTTVDAKKEVRPKTDTLNPKITVLYPNGGEQLVVGAGKDVDFRVTWDAVDTTVASTAYVYLNSIDGSMCYLGSVPLQKLNFPVTIGANYRCANIAKTITDGKYLIRVTSDIPSSIGDMKGVNDASDDYVTIKNFVASTNTSKPTITLTRTNPHGTVGENTVVTVTAAGATKAVVSNCSFNTSEVALPFSYSGLITADFVKGSPQDCRWTVTNSAGSATAVDQFQYCGASTSWNGSRCAAAGALPSISLTRTNPHGTEGEYTYVSVTGSGASAVAVTAVPGRVCDFAAPSVAFPFSFSGPIAANFIKSSPQACRWTVTNAAGSTYTDDEFEYCASGTVWNGLICTSSSMRRDVSTIPSGSLVASLYKKIFNADASSDMLSYWSNYFNINGEDATTKQLIKTAIIDLHKKVFGFDISQTSLVKMLPSASASTLDDIRNILGQ